MRVICALFETHTKHGILVHCTIRRRRFSVNDARAEELNWASSSYGLVCLVLPHSLCMQCIGCHLIANSRYCTHTHWCHPFNPTTIKYSLYLRSRVSLPFRHSLPSVKKNYSFTIDFPHCLSLFISFQLSFQLFVTCLPSLLLFYFLASTSALRSFNFLH